KARKAKLRLDLREGILKELEDGGAVVKPGDPAKSEMVRRIFATDEDDLMPPPKSNLKLSAAEKELLKNWIAQGAEIKPHWSLNPVQPVTPPPRGGGAASPTVAATPASRATSASKGGDEGVAATRNAIDAFVLARLETEGLQTAPEAAREILIRRLALDLTGLPPTVAEMDSLLADKSPDAYARAVEHYLNSPAYGE